MTCQACGEAMQSSACACGWKLPAMQSGQSTISHVIQTCSQPGCTVAIRVPIGQTQAHPVCKWCERKEPKATLKVPGVPNHDNPWPWQTPLEIERRLRLPFWRSRILEVIKRRPEYAVLLRRNMDEIIEEKPAELAELQPKKGI